MRQRGANTAPEWHPPEAVTVLGDLGACAFYRRENGEGRYYGMDPVPGRVLVCDPGGRRMWILRPLAPARPVKPSALAIHAMELRERFIHRRGDGWINTFVPPVTSRPRLVGDMAIISYYEAKGKNEPDAEWVHYFEGPDAPAFARFYALGRDQFYFCRGAWRVAPDGIAYADPDED